MTADRNSRVTPGLVLFARLTLLSLVIPSEQAGRAHARA